MTPSFNVQRNAATTLCAVGLLAGAVVPAQAMPTFKYDALLDVTWELTSVTDSSDNDVDQGWSAEATSSDIFDDRLITDGEATAVNEFSLALPTALGIGDSVSQSSSVAGSATKGSSQAFGWTEMLLNVVNETATELTFLFDGNYSASVNVSGPSPGSDEDRAAAYAQLVQLNPVTFAFVEEFVTISEDTLIGPAQTAQFELTVGANSTGGALLTVDTYGEADASGTIPVPAPLALLTAGLVGLVGLQRAGSGKR